MKQRFYFDTSVFGGIYDIEFEEESLQLFERVKLGKIICMYSDLTETELLKAPENVRNYFYNLPKQNVQSCCCYMKTVIKTCFPNNFFFNVFSR